MPKYLKRVASALYSGLIVATPAGAAGEKTLDTITVTSTLDDVAERRESAAQKVIVTKQDIEAMGVLTIGDVMGKLPGVDAGTPGADGSMALRSRGMVRDSVQILVDGERVHHNARVAQGIVGRLPATELLRVEIIRGSSAEVGGSAPLTVNLVLAKPLSRDSTAVKAAVGLRGDRPIAQTNFTKGGGDKSFSWLLPITLNHHEMPSARHAVRRDSTGLWQEDSEQGDRRTTEFVVSPRLTWKAGRDNLTLNPVLFRSFGPSENAFERTDLVVPTDSSTRSDNTESRNAFNRLRADAELYRQDVKYSGRLNVSDGERRSDTRRTGITAGGLVTLADEHTRRKERDYGGSLRADWNSGAHVLAAALEHATHRREEYQSHSGLGFDETHEGWDQQTSMWLQDEWSITPATTITGGLRGEFLRYAIDNAGQSHQRLLPSIAVKWTPAEQWVLRSSLGAGIKPPRLDELTNQPLFSVNANTPLEPDRRGNPQLKPEHSLNLEGVLERYLPGEAGVLGANLYLRHTRNFIERRVQFEGVRWVERPYNEGTARHWGVELDAKLRTDNFGWRGATFRAHLTVPRSRVEDERLDIRRAAREQPRYIISAGYDQTLGDRSFGMSFQHSGRMQTAVPDEQAYETRRRTVVDAYVLQKLSRELNLRFSLQNLFRADMRRQMEAFAPGSSWYLSTEERSARTLLLSLEGKW